MDLNQLNDRQRQAVLTTEGPVLVLAGAGSGKTKVLTTRIAYLMEQKLANRYEIVAITFTNKAASEMKDRVSKLLNADVSDMWIGTFHSICTRILRRDITHIGYNSSFTIYDREDQKSLVKEILKEKNIETKSFQFNSFLSIVSQAKNLGEGRDYIEANYGDNPTTRFYGEFYEEYIHKCEFYNALDFDDIIIKTLELFDKNPDIRKKYSDRFKYVFVDEYQDTNKSQYELMQTFGKTYGNVCVVGDADQSIYGWRGADISNILNFEKDFPGAKVIKLEENYRSTQKILNVANQVIENNEGRKEKSLWTSKGEGSDIPFLYLPGDREESLQVVQWIEHMHYEGYHFSDMAILYRTNAQSRGFEEMLLREGVPYKVIGGLKFYDRMEIKDTIAYLKTIINPNDNISVKRIINKPKRGIGQATVDKLENFANNYGISIYDFLFEEELKSIGTRSLKKLEEFRNMITDMKSNIEKFKVSEFVEYVLERSGYLKELEKSNLREDQTRIENIGSFINAIVDYEENTEEPSLEDYLASVSLLSDVDKTEENEAGVSLMTIHAAKGLEYKVVFVTGLEDGLFPSGRSIDEREGLEEERRLCYVAVTRAEERLFLTGAQMRRVFGETKMTVPSRFIKEMGGTIVEEETKETTEINFRESYGDSVSTMKASVRDNLLGAKTAKKVDQDLADEEFKAGDRVVHKKFGEGMVVSVTEREGGDELVISFEKKGIKKLNKNLAPIKRI